MDTPCSTALADELHTILASRASATFAASRRRYALRGTGTILGVPTKEVRAIAKDAFSRLPDHSIDIVHAHCEALLSKNVYELMTVALQWSFACRAQARPPHIEVYEHWLREYIDERAYCDDLCIHTIGTLILTFPETIHAAKSWARERSWVMRRAAAVSLVPAARKGQYMDHILDIAELLQKEEDRLVQKGIGWLLRTARKTHGDEISSFLEDYRRTMSPAIIREASTR